MNTRDIGGGRPNVDLLSYERLLEVVIYDPITGIFTRRIDKHGHVKNEVMGCVTKSGHVDIMIDKVRYQAHRLAWLYVNGAWPCNKLDHKNRIPHDNRYENLRIANDSENSQNQGLSSRNTTGAKGVSIVNGKIIAYIHCNKKKYWLGTTHKTIDEAAHAYNKKAIELFGEFAVLNPIGEDYAVD